MVHIMKFYRILIVCTMVCCISSSTHADTKPIVVTTIQPIASIVKEITGSQAEVISLLPANASPHIYEPKPSDVKATQNSIVLFYVAPHLDDWATKLPAAKKIELISLLPKEDLLPFYGHAHDHSPGEHEEKIAHEEIAYDPHIWMDPILVGKLVAHIKETLCELDGKNCKSYTVNAQSLKQRLRALNNEIERQINTKTKNSFLLAYPFGHYFFRRYNLKPMDTVVQSPGKLPTPRRIKQMAVLLGGTDSKVIFTLPQLSAKPANVVAEAIGGKVVTLDPLGQNNNDSYFDVMRKLAKDLSEALK